MQFRDGTRYRGAPVSDTLRSVVWLTLGDRSVASSRVRAFALSDELTMRGAQSVCAIGAGLRGRIRALWHLFSRGGPDVVVIQKLLYGPLMLRILRARAKTLVWECDDALHMGSPLVREDLDRQRRLIGAALDTVDLVTTSNTLLERELQPKSGRTLLLRGPAPPPIAEVDARRVQIAVWLGSKWTEPYLELLGDAALELRRDGWRCVAIGASADIEHLGWEPVEWSLAHQHHWLAHAMVGVMPQDDDPWSERKQGYKLFEYIAHGVVPVASNVRAARELLVGEELDSLLVEDGGDWARTIRDAGRSRAAVMPRLRAILDRHSIAAAIDAWSSEVGFQTR
jgi:hypothetical protein